MIILKILPLKAVIRFERYPKTILKTLILMALLKYLARTPNVES